MGQRYAVSLAPLPADGFAGFPPLELQEPAAMLKRDPELERRAEAAGEIGLRV